MLSIFRKLKQALKRLKGGAEAAIAEPYEAQCECGATVTGVRRRSWIEAECQSCYQSIFILPANVYPATKRVPSSVLGGSFSERFKVVVAELLPERKQKPEAKEPETTPASEQTASAPRRRRFQFPQIDVRRLVRRTFTPFRVLMMAMTAVVGLTSYWMIHERAVEAAQQTWLRASDELDTLLRERKFASLETLLSDAVAAGEVLGKQDSEWRQLRNLLDETRAVNNIANEDLLTAFHEAYDGQNLREDAENGIRRVTRSGIFVFETWLRPAADSSSDFLVDLPAAPGQHAVEVHIALPAISEFLSTAPDGRALFAATIAAVQAPRSAGDSWQLSIDPDSFVLLTSTHHCEDLGLPLEFDPELTALLARQKDFVTSSPSWEYRSGTIRQSPSQMTEQESFEQ